MVALKETEVSWMDHLSIVNVCAAFCDCQVDIEIFKWISEVMFSGEIVLEYSSGDCKL